MHRFAPVALATILAATVPARPQAPAPQPPPAKFTDPANLAGERVRPRNGRELPIDGGLSADGKPDNALGLAQQLRRLNTRASLMLIVAHPDDEDGGMLTYYSRGLGARVAVLTLTRGEGGQNAMTGDFEDALGLLRTQELLSADRYMGVDQFFGTQVDFGFTKTKEEAFKKWGHDRVLYDAVRAVRIYRPLVIAAVFSGAVTDGHGQHQVSGQIAQEVFKAAGDPNVFPELTKEGILPWQPLKVYARIPFSRVTDKGLYDYATGQTVPAQFTNYVTGQTFTTAPTADVTINEGQTDPLLTWAATDLSDLRTKPTNLSEQLSYVQFARIGLGLQRSQIGGGDRNPRPGRVDVSYHLYGSRVCAPGLPNPTPNLCTSSQSANKNSVILSEGSQQRAVVEEPRVSSPSHNSAALFHLVSQPTPSNEVREEAPTARPIPAQGIALGNEEKEAPSAEGAPYNPSLDKQPSFFDGIDTTVAGIGSLAPNLGEDARKQLLKLALQIEYATRLKNENGSNVASLLAQALRTDDALIQLIDESKLDTPARVNLLHELRIKRVQLNNALALALGLNLDATTQSDALLVDSSAAVHIRLDESSGIRLGLPSFRLHNASGSETLDRQRGVTTASASARSANQQYPIENTIQASGNLLTPVTKPYFFRANDEEPVYRLRDPELRNAPQTPPALSAFAFIPYEGLSITLAHVVHSGSQPVQIIPPVSLTLDRNAQVIPNGTSSLNVNVHTVSEDHPEGDLIFQTPVDWDVKSLKRPFRAGTETFSVTLPEHSHPATLNAEAIISGTIYTDGFRPVGYGTLPRTNFYTPATLRVVPVNLKLPPENKRRIAYLPGTGDDVPAALASIGLSPTILKVSDLTPDRLSQFDTVILGVRTYNAHPDLHGAPTQALFDFAGNGGNVVVQYQTPEFGAADAPYPLTTHNERVIDETAPVKLLDPGSTLLTTPNKISPADFNGWVEERGHGFLDTWDSHYTALTETGDPGAPAEHIQPQEPQRGGLVTVQLSKGRWTYCAFALYRQLPEAVPGAFRLFVNLLNP